MLILVAATVLSMALGDLSDGLIILVIVAASGTLGFWQERTAGHAKERIVRALRQRHQVVGFLGDGINDAAALHAADVGMSVDTAVDVARQAAAIVLLDKSLAVVADGVRLGRQTFADTPSTSPTRRPNAATHPRTPRPRPACSPRGHPGSLGAGGASRGYARAMHEVLCPVMVGRDEELPRDDQRPASMKHLGILAHSAEGAALCFRAFCQEGFARLGPHDHPDVTMDCIALARSMPAWDAGDHDAVRARPPPTAAPGSACSAPGT